MTRPVGGQRVGSAALDYYADGPVAVKREVGMGDFLMASVVLKAAKLAKSGNRTTLVASSPRPVSREWLAGIPWADEIAATWPEDVPQERRIDLQTRLQFDFGWWGGVYERVEVGLGRAGVPKDLWAAAARPDYCPDPESFDRGVSWLREHGVPDEARFIFVSASSLGAPGRRSLPEAYFTELLARLLRDTDAWVFAAGATEPSGVDASRLLTMTIDVQTMTDLLYQTDLLLTTDTGPLHIGTCFGTPTVAWFSSSPPWSRITHYPNAVGIFNADGCARNLWPCTRRGRPHCQDATCMSGVPLDSVMELVRERLARPPHVRIIGPQPGEASFAEVAAEAEERGARHIPSTPNVGWETGRVVIDEGRRREEELP